MQAKVEDKETVSLIEGAAAGMVATVESKGPEAIADWEVDELLDWTTTLNFEDYLGEWKALATSACSEAAAGQSERNRFLVHIGFQRYMYAEHEAYTCIVV